MVAMDRRLASLQRQLLEDPENNELRSYYGSSLRRIYSRGLVQSLVEFNHWQSLTSLEQDAVFAFLNLDLSPEYRWRGAWHPGERGVEGALRVGRFVHRRTDLFLHLIPGGRFRMGSMEGLRDEQPPVALTLRPFLLGQAPVLNKQWELVSPEFKSDGAALPRTGLSWYGARVWLTKAGGRLRLPQESEWEYACRGPKQDSSYFWGDDFDSGFCWCLENSGGRKQKPRLHFGFENLFGLIDMSGNVWEWCDDKYKDYRSGQPAPEDVPLRLYPLRGGSYKSEAEACGSTRRLAANVRHRQVDFGLRVARSLPESF